MKSVAWEALHIAAIVAVCLLFNSAGFACFLAFPIGDKDY